MIKRIFISAFTLLLALGLSWAISVSAQTASSSLQSIQYPIASLGNCASRQDCKTYCDDSSHADACLTFAEQNGLMSQSDIHRAKSFESLVVSGKTPGGCDSKDACQTYCHDQTHASECLQFAQDNGLVSSQQAKRAQSFLKNGGPGGCTTKSACEAYCNDTAHATECLDFAKQNGLIDSNTADQVEQDMARIQSGINGTNGNELGQCLHDELGQNGLEKVQSGQLTPDTSTLSKVRACFSRVGKQVNQNAEDSVSKAPQAVQTCLQTAVGPDDFKDLENGQPPKLEDASKVRDCFSKGHGKGSVSPNGTVAPTGTNQLQNAKPSNLPISTRSASASENEHDLQNRRLIPQPPQRPQFNPFPTNEPERPNRDSSQSGHESFLGPQGLVGAIVHFFSH